MDPEEERLEVEPTLAGDDDLAVQDAALRDRRPERRFELREVSIEGLQVARLDVDLVAVSDYECPEPVPLRLEEPALALGQRVGRLGEHRLDRRFEGQSH